MSCHLQAREASESAEASRQTSAVASPILALSPADIPSLLPRPIPGDPAQDPRSMPVSGLEQAALRPESARESAISEISSTVAEHAPGRSISGDDSSRMKLTDDAAAAQSNLQNAHVLITSGSGPLESADAERSSNASAVCPHQLQETAAEFRQPMRAAGSGTSSTLTSHHQLDQAALAHTPTDTESGTIGASLLGSVPSGLDAPSAAAAAKDQAADGSETNAEAPARMAGPPLDHPPSSGAAVSDSSHGQNSSHATGRQTEDTGDVVESPASVTASQPQDDPYQQSMDPAGSETKQDTGSLSEQPLSATAAVLPHDVPALDRNQSRAPASSETKSPPKSPTKAGQEWVARMAEASRASVEGGMLSGLPQAGMHGRRGSVPVAAVVEAYISDRILAQHRCVSQACVRSV